MNKIRFHKQNNTSLLSDFELFCLYPNIATKPFLLPRTYAKEEQLLKTEYKKRCWNV